MTTKEATNQKMEERPPVVVIMGHVDHGKSTLLDYIRESNIVGGEAGGITQHIGAYEVLHKTKDGAEKKITFVDTPGHAAFTEMRSRGARVADIAILVVAAEEGVKAQTLEALGSITKADIPYIVAINKIDKPGANADKAKQSLAEQNVFVEGWGGSIPVVSLSAKTGENIDELLDMILLVAELGELKADTDASAEGVIIESHTNPKTGVDATAVIKNGTLSKGDCIVAGDILATVRTIEDFTGKKLDSATVSAPVKITGWSGLPPVGSSFVACKTKKEAEEIQAENKKNPAKKVEAFDESAFEAIIPLVIKADTIGTLEAAEKELLKLSTERVGIKLIQKGVGAISEADVKITAGSERPIVIGFNVSVDRAAKDLSEQMKVTPMVFDVIYHASEFLEKEVEQRELENKEPEPTGVLKVLKLFSQTKKKQVVGGEVIDGVIKKGAQFKIFRRENEIGSGKIVGLQSQKEQVSEVHAGNQCGLEAEARFELASGDELKVF